MGRGQGSARGKITSVTYGTGGAYGFSALGRKLAGQSTAAVSLRGGKGPAYKRTELAISTKRNPLAEARAHRNFVFGQALRQGATREQAEKRATAAFNRRMARASATAYNVKAFTGAPLRGGKKTARGKLEVQRIGPQAAQRAAWQAAMARRRGAEAGVGKKGARATQALTERVGPGFKGFRSREAARGAAGLARARTSTKEQRALERGMKRVGAGFGRSASKALARREKTLKRAAIASMRAASSAPKTVMAKKLGLTMAPKATPVKAKAPRVTPAAKAPRRVVRPVVSTSGLSAADKALIRSALNISPKGRGKGLTLRQEVARKARQGKPGGISRASAMAAIAAVKPEVRARSVRIMRRILGMRKAAASRKAKK